MTEKIDLLGYNTTHSSSKKTRPDKKYSVRKFKKAARERGLSDENYRLSVLAKQNIEKYYHVGKADACQCGCQTFITYNRKCLDCKKREASVRMKNLWKKIKE